MSTANLIDNVQDTFIEGERNVRRGANWFYQDFTSFLGRDNVLEVALGLIIGGAFSTLVTSLVQDVVLPPISLLSANSRNLQSHFWILRRGDTPDLDYNTLDQAAADGAIYMAYGRFFQKSIDFLTLGLSLYFLIKIFTIAGSDSIVKHTSKCEFCRKQISEKALRCPFCTSWQSRSLHPN